MRAGRVPQEALVCFEAVTGDQWVRAGDLEMYRSLRNDAALAWQGAFLKGPPPLLTAALVGVQIRIWWSTWIPGVGDRYVRHFTNFAPPTLEDGESWRLLSMGLLHTETFHIALNMMWLAYTGMNLERALGRMNLATLYFASVVGGSLLSMLGSPETRSLGASGGVFGLVAASVVFGFSRPELLPERGRQLFGAAMLPYLVLMFWSGLMNEGTDNWSHFGGLLVGGVLALILDPVPLQRRPGWNRAWQVATASVCAVLLLGLSLGGPRLHPLPDHNTARARITGASPLAPERYSPLSWAVPAGWRPGMTPSGDPGFKSPAGNRSYAAVHREERTPPTPETLYDDWVQRLKRGWPDAQVSPPETTTLAGRPALQAVAHLASEEEGARVVTWTGAVRGVYTLQEIWEVEAHRQGRLQPLRHRLRDRLIWEEPAQLVEAHRDWTHLPRSRRTRSNYAAALLRAGEVQPALELYVDLLDEVVEQDVWTGLLQLLQWHPDLEQADALWDRALRELPSPRVVVEVAKGLEAAGREAEAVGLLDLAWGRTPGERILRRARQIRGLSTALTDDHLPWGAVFDPITGQPRPLEDREARLAAEPGLEAAADRGALLGRERQALVEATLEALGDRSPAAVDRLLLLRDGHPPDDRQAATASLRVDLQRAADGDPPRWVPEALAEALQDEPEGIVALLGEAEAGEAP